VVVRQAWHDFLADIERYSHVLGRSKWTVLFFAQGAQASVVYRIGHWWYTKLNPKNPLVRGLHLLHFIFFRGTEILTGISLEPKAEIGPGLYIGHFGGIIVGSGVRLGANCNLSQGVTLGVDGRGEKRGSPQIGDRVFIGPGANVFGKITIGHDVVIGANAVVNRSLPDRAVAVGVPAKIVSYEGSFDFVTYAGMEQDAARIESLRLVAQGSEELGDTRPRQ
jgi:serine O-acetyltransferase